jgi:hypothetical protein
MYDPSVGRFISSDPAKAGDNWFAYCEDNPLAQTDPLGLYIPPPGYKYTPPLPWEDMRKNLRDNLKWIWGGIQKASEAVEAIGNFIGGSADGGGSIGDPYTDPKMPHNPGDLDPIVGTPGRQIPDGPDTPGRNKIIWEPAPGVKIIHEQHPYHPTAPDFHKGPHYHYDIPGVPHKRVLPGEDMPEELRRALGH